MLKIQIRKQVHIRRCRSKIDRIVYLVRMRIFLSFDNIKTALRNGVNGVIFLQFGVGLYDRAGAAPVQLRCFANGRQLLTRTVLSFPDFSFQIGTDRHVFWHGGSPHFLFCEHKTISLRFCCDFAVILLRSTANFQGFLNLLNNLYYIRKAQLYRYSLNKKRLYQSPFRFIISCKGLMFANKPKSWKGNE
jgi:hypothetical protein